MASNFMNDTIIQVENLSKSFHVGTEDTPILKDISFEIKRGDFLVIVGPSGCGKSTLLHSLIGLEIPTSGKVELLAKDIYKNSTEDERSRFRKHHIGMVYQQPNWIKSYTVLDNIIFPLLLIGEDKQKLVSKASKVLTEVEMMHWFYYIPSELSSGQQQKIALARALVTDPEIIVADEPTGNLDYKSGQELMSLLSNLSDQGKTIIMVTHDLEYIRYAKTAIAMFDGKIVKRYDEKETKILSQKVALKRGAENLFEGGIE